MVTQKSQRIMTKSVREREDLVRRSKYLSDPAKLLWIELVRGWAWDDLSAKTTQESLACALNWSKRKVIRVLGELRDKGLIEITRKGNGSNTYHLPSKIPDYVCTQDRLINKALRMKRFRPATCPQQVTESSAPSTGDRIIMVTESSIEGDRIINFERDRIINTKVTESSHIDEYKDEKEDEKRMSTLREKNLTHGAVYESQYLSENHQVIETETIERETGTDSGMTTEDAQDDLDDLLEEQSEEAANLSDSRNKSKTLKRAATPPRHFSKRSSDSSLVGSACSGELSQSRSQPVQRTGIVNPLPMAPEKPQDVLELLRAEIRSKYGSKYAAGVTIELTKKEAGQVRNCLLTKFTPDVLIKMIRVLVWDWEIARKECFPPRPSQAIPSVGDLVRYRAWLSGAIETGFRHTDSKLGGASSYASKFLDPSEKINDDDPF